MSSYLKNTQFVQRWLISVAKGMQQPVEQLAKALRFIGLRSDMMGFVPQLILRLIFIFGLNI
jgi:predicted choloylglycine hydrolase